MSENTCDCTVGVYPTEAPTPIRPKDRETCGGIAVARKRVRYGHEPANSGNAGHWYTVCGWHDQDPGRIEGDYVWTEVERYAGAEDDQDAHLRNNATRGCYREFTGPTCEHCTSPLPARGTGRPARFCSTRCRVAAHRAMKRTMMDTLAAHALPEDAPGAWIKAAIREMTND